MKLQLTVYPAYCAYEWVIYFTNISDTITENVSELYAADLMFCGNEPILKGICGDGKEGTKICYYTPYEVDLKKQPQIAIANKTGRSSEYSFPYFNLQYGNGGAFIAIGWPGSWSCTFEYKNTGVRFKAGQQYFNARLEPGETIRTPLMAFLFYDTRNDNAALNLWRNWFIDCNMRLIENELFKPQTAAYTGQFTAEMVTATDSNQIEFMKSYLEHGIKLDYWWMDAGWYFKTGHESLTTWIDTGNLNVDTKRFPSEFADISEFAAQHDMKTLLWFEPEVVRLPNELLDEDGIKPEWILGENGTWRLANMGIPEFVDWLFDKVTSIIEKGGISLYRQDYGIASPLSLWLNNDTPGREGITENLYVQGYLSYWDRLIDKFPDMMIDSCASGGNRNDLETMRRSLPLHKTDYNYSDFDMKQAMHLVLFQWLPYFGTMTTCATLDTSIYALRSSYCPWYASSFDISKKEFNWEELKQAFHEFEIIKEFFMQNITL